MNTFEVEIKSLLGSSEKADFLRKSLKEIDPTTVLTSKNKQLNHYFIGGDLEKLQIALENKLSDEVFKKLVYFRHNAKEVSVRTREKDGKVLLVIKASMGSDTSSNGVARMEFEEKVDLSLKELDNVLLGAGFEYQAKWSREREEYAFKGINVVLDKNAGYGWLAEFEKVVPNESELDSAKLEIERLMKECGVAELPQDRLERMFKFYNEHWPEYYGTDKIFTVE